MVGERIDRMYVAGLIAMFVVGCGERSGLQPVNGRVIYSDGQPLPGGVIEMRPTSGEQKASPRGPIHADGTFAIGTIRPGDGAMPGTYRVLIVPPPPAGDPDDKAIRNTPPAIDERYTRFETSGLEVVVNPDVPTNEFQITVERPAQ